MPPLRSRAPLRENYLEARVRALNQHPEVWRAVPNGLTLQMARSNAGAAALWREVVAFLVGYGLASPLTNWQDVNVPKLIRLVRELEA